MDEKVKNDIKKEADEIMERGSVSLNEIRQMMRKSGKSFKQVMQDSARLKKEMDSAKKQAESEGKYFDEKAYLKSRMNGGGTKIIVKHR